MSYVLGQPFVVGRYTVSVVSEQRSMALQAGRERLTLACHKAPAFIIVQEGQGVTALDMTGARVTLAQVAALCPAVQALSWELPS